MEKDRLFENWGERVATAAGREAGSYLVAAWWLVDAGSCLGSPNPFRSLLDAQGDPWSGAKAKRGANLQQLIINWSGNILNTFDLFQPVSTEFVSYFSSFPKSFRLRIELAETCWNVVVELRCRLLGRILQAKAWMQERSAPGTPNGWRVLKLLGLQCIVLFKYHPSSSIYGVDLAPSNKYIRVPCWSLDSESIWWPGAWLR